jgi:hypothetical protein
MRPFRQYRAGFAWSAAIAMAGSVLLSPAAALAAETKTKANLAQVMKRTVLVFPFDVPSTVGNRDDVRGLLTDMAISRMQAAGSYSVTQYHRSLPTVARLQLDQQLTEADTTEPYAEDNTKGTKIAKLAGYDAIFLGSVDDYQYDETQKQAKVLLNGRLIDIKTGKLIGTPVTLQAASGTGGTAKEADRALEAARNAGQQLMTKLVPVVDAVVTPPTKTPTPPSQAPKKKKRNDWLWGLLAVGLGLGIGLSTSGGSGGGGGGTDNPPPPPN